MSYIKTLLHALADGFITGDTEYPDEAIAEAEQLAHETGMAIEEAMVVVGDKHDLPEYTIDREIVMSGRSAEEIRHTLRQRRRELDDEAKRTARAKDALDSWSKAD